MEQTNEESENEESATKLFDVEEMSRNTPVIEESKAKRVGPGYRMVQYCAMKDCRNKPKYDNKGKLISQKKGKAQLYKSMNPNEL